MTFRSDDEKDLLTQFLAWLIKNGSGTATVEKGLATVMFDASEKQLVEEFLKARKIE